MKIEFEPGQISSSQLRVPKNTGFILHVEQYSVEMARMHTFGEARKAAIKELSEKLGIDVSEGFDQIDHNVMNKLLSNMLKKVAQEFARNPDVFRQNHSDIFSIAGEMVKQVNVNTFGPTETEEKLVKQLNQLIQSTFSQH